VARTALLEERPVMTREQIRYWVQKGIEFGSHTRTRADLTMLDSSALESEIAGSADDLRAILGAPVESFAYLYGRFSVSLRRVVEQIYRAAFTCEEGLNDRTTDSCLVIIAILYAVAWIALLDEGDHQVVWEGLNSARGRGPMAMAGVGK
jgi:peptidoglycan/xylan/chitin deacetylase (PgdA/CDA1 family)